MGQLAYHIAMGIPLWDYPVRKGTVLYLALEDDYARLQRRLSQMFGIESADNLYFATQAKTLKEGLDGELEEFVKQHTDARLIIITAVLSVRFFFCIINAPSAAPSNPFVPEIISKLSPDSILRVWCKGRPEWEGTATELLKQLPDMQLSANVLSRKLNVVNSQLLNDYGIFYDNKRGHERRIILKRLERNE